MSEPITLVQPLPYLIGKGAITAWFTQELPPKRVIGKRVPVHALEPSGWWCGELYRAGHKLPECHWEKANVCWWKENPKRKPGRWKTEGTPWGQVRTWVPPENDLKLPAHGFFPTGAVGSVVLAGALEWCSFSKSVLQSAGKFRLTPRDRRTLRHGLNFILREPGRA